MVTDKNQLPSVAVGRMRDQKIIELISEHGPFYRDQVQQLIFPTHKWPQKCSQRLNKLTQAGKIKRIRFDKDGQYVYFTGKWTHKSEHVLAVNWVYTSLLAQKKSWFKIQAFQREYGCSWGDHKLFADAFVVLVNTAKGTLKPVFVEVDNATNPMDKVQIYTEYFTSNAWVGQWWAKKDSEGFYTFPRILVITDKPNRVHKAIERDNVKGLKFNVATLEQVKQDVYVCL